MTRVLLAEDDPEIQLVARMALQWAKFEVVLAVNGLEAVAKAAAERPDVILLDWMMPDLDGPGACERLKADPATRDIPVIFLTARSQKSEVERGVALGAIGHIAKPFNALTLGAEVRRLLEGR